MPSYLVTGASRGLGLGFVTELLKDKNNVVVATARDLAGSEGLQKLKAEVADGKLHLVELDVSKPESIRAAAEKTSQLLPNGLDHLVSNAGVIYQPLSTFDDLDLDVLKNEIDFTVTSPINLLREFLPLIRKSEAKRILVITSILGSLDRAVYLPNLAIGYSIARAALNMVVRKWSTPLKSEGITIALVHPGWVNVTEVGDGITEWMNKYAPDAEKTSLEVSAAGCMKVLNGLTLENSGAYLSYDGTTLPL
ncbi:putative short-chain dehydrogenase [Thozetella sp. PMI_491]|nr:putative short-chain dehydrogenase [Thozetella sp. PMI_491]